MNQIHKTHRASRVYASDVMDEGVVNSLAQPVDVIEVDGDDAPLVITQNSLTTVPLVNQWDGHFQTSKRNP